jgi:hypothetical protein
MNALQLKHAQGKWILTVADPTLRMIGKLIAVLVGGGGLAAVLKSFGLL